jgi:hypothetical protein
MSALIKHENQRQEIQTLKAMAAIAVSSGKYGADYNESTVLNIFLTAKSLGVDPMVALNGGFQIIKGKINMGAHFMTALARRKGHSIKVIEMTDKKCVIIGQRKDNGDSLKYEFTWEEAQRAKLTNKDNWQNNPKQMLYCGCVRNVFRILFSDIGIAYDPDEMNEEPAHSEDALNIEVSPVIPMTSVKLKDEKPLLIGTAFDTLKEHLEIDGINATHLKEYIDGLARKKEQPGDTIVESALTPQLLPIFKATYSKWLANRPALQEQEAEPISA